jgi:hypothetical protein
MTVQTSANAYVQGFGTHTIQVAIPFSTAPGPTQVNYPLFQIGVVESTNSTYMLTSFTPSNGQVTATWTLLGAGAGDLNTLTGGTGGAISPSAGNITLAGTTNQITTTGSGSTITFSVPSTFVAPGSITATLGAITATNGNLNLATAGNKLLIATGANASIGTSAAMTAGTITISTTAVTASSKIFLTANTLAGTPGTLSAPTGSITAGTSFVITSSSSTDTSTVNWWIVN